MKKLLPLLLMLVSCHSSHDSVDDEYSRGFFNCLSIIEHRHPELKAVDLPYWQECKKSYLSEKDLFNYWDKKPLSQHRSPKFNCPK